MTSPDAQLSPVDVLGVSDVAQIAMGFGHACARTTEGRVSCWGFNAAGQVGDGTTTDRSAPVTVSFP